ncbi:hypothetical protein EZV62_012263 [Acer yangbiense]|uniref:Photosystem I P700 chlorophyll a apoprotein A2 n=1 Tax=Acer yangbiense TaxID=1000413 RepID=A0A5C7HVD8_9ROSI|nr:hypothetical protein EZV62_012263 [Acer yangbiense]
MFSNTAIQLQPVFAQWIQNTHALAPGGTAPSATASTSLTWGGGDLVAVGGKVALLPIPLGTTDFLVHHIHAFMIHVTSDVWGSISDQGVVIQSYGSSLSAYGLFFLGAHFVWAFSLMFLFSGLGYWQELIESIVWAHNKLKVAPATQPRALSIVQGRAVGEDLKGIMALRFPRFSQGLAQDPTTRRIWFGIATAHDFESHDDITEERLYQNIFASHFGQLAIIFLWTSGNLFHVAWQGNFEAWVQDPLHVRPIAHAIWDPHFGQPAVEAFSRGGALGPVNIAYSGVYQWWYTIGLRTNEDLYTGALFLLFLSAISLIAGWLHLQPKWKPSVSWFKNAESRLNHHLSGLFGVSSLAWTGHLVHVAIPASRGEYVRWNNFLDVLPHPQGLGPLFTDIAHHHLAIAFIFLIAGHMYRTNFGIGHRIKDLLEAHIPPGGLCLGFHTLGLYVHNDVMLAFGTPEKQILIEPIFAQWIQSTHGKTSYGFNVLLSSTNGPAFNAGQSIWLPGWLTAINENSNSLFLTIGPGDFLVHHAIALGLHTTTLISVKGA